MSKQYDSNTLPPLCINNVVPYSIVKHAKPLGDTQLYTSYLVWYKLVHSRAMREHHTNTILMHHMQHASPKNAYFG